MEFSYVLFGLGCAVGVYACKYWMEWRAKIAREADKQAKLETTKRLKQYDLSVPSNQLNFVTSATLYAKRPINAEAYRIFNRLETFLPTLRKKYRLLAEVSLGAFIGVDSATGGEKARSRAYKSYGGKRVDFLVIDPFGRPALAIEYHGSGHYQADATERDAVKKAALEKAGVALLEIHAEADMDQELATVSKYLNMHEQSMGGRSV